MTVNIFSALGSVVYKNEFADVSPFSAVTIDLSTLVPGTYTAQVIMDGVEYKQQIVKL
jgi:hypothetical protein